MILRAENLSVALPVRDAGHWALRHVVRGVGFTVGAGEILGVVGESGCGKSVTNLALMGLLPDGARVTAARLELCGIDLLSLRERDWPAVRGSKAAMIFQNPMSALNPSLSIGQQLMESVRKADAGCSRAQCRERAVALLDRVGVAAPQLRMKSYPHELSGGMAQRAMIAMALACEPALLIADEPTTALDVSIEAQILDLIAALAEERGMAVILVSHDIGVVRRYAQRIQVMYAGEIVESAPAAHIARSPAHPYTRALLRSLPGRNGVPPKTLLAAIPGMVPPIGAAIAGCRFAARCADAKPVCHSQPAPLRTVDGAVVRCHF